MLEIKNATIDKKIGDKTERFWLSLQKCYSKEIYVVVRTWGDEISPSVYGLYDSLEEAEHHFNWNIDRHTSSDRICPTTINIYKKSSLDEEKRETAESSLRYLKEMFMGNWI